MATSEPVVVSWKKEGLLLEGATAHGRLDMASGLDEPGQGATPMELLAASLEVVYYLKGAQDENKVRRAIELSETKCCSVEATLRPAVSISSRYVLEA
jgi:uncharacterized OsmC-like protein